MNWEWEPIGSWLLHTVGLESVATVHVRVHVHICLFQKMVQMELHTVPRTLTILLDVHQYLPKVK
jgi:hypothetical protein